MVLFWSTDFGGSFVLEGMFIMTDRKRIRIHDFQFCTRPNADGFSLGNIAGIGMYPDRSVLLPGIVYLDGSHHSEVIKLYWHEYLHAIGIGASELRFVEGESLFAGILNDRDERVRLAQELSNGRHRTLEAFSASVEFDQFVDTLGLDSSRLRTPTLEVMRLIDDKEYFRRLAGELGMPDVFPNHAFATEPAEVLGQICAYRKRYPRLVVVKRPDLESGVGQLLIRPGTSDREIEAFVRLYATGHRPIIIEEGVFGTEASLQWNIGSKGPERRFFGRQYTSDGAHEGNVISHDGIDCLPSEWSYANRFAIIEKIWEATGVFVEWIEKQGYIGPIGFDFFVEEQGFKFLECNARTTAATYLEKVRYQVEANGFSNLSAAMKNVYPKHARSWRHAVTQLTLHDDHMAFDPDRGTGVIIANPRLFHLPKSKCLAIAVGDSVEHAEQLLHQAIAIL